MRRGGRAVRSGDRVPHANILKVLEPENQVTHLSRTQAVDLHELELQDADFFSHDLAAGLHETKRLAGPHLPIQDPDIDDNTTERIKDGIKYQGFKRRIGFGFRSR